MARWDAETVRHVMMPIVVAVGCSHQLAARCQTAVRRAAAQLREVPDVSILESPLEAALLLVPQSLFASQREVFEYVAKAADIEVLAIDRDDVDATELSDRILNALVEAERRRGLTRKPTSAP